MAAKLTFLGVDPDILPPSSGGWIYRWVERQATALIVDEERRMVELICAAHSRGRVPRYVWRYPEESQFHSGEDFPSDGPWLVYTITPAAVAMALGISKDKP